MMYVNILLFKKFLSVKTIQYLEKKHNVFISLYQQLYRCPANWYRLIVRNIDTDEQVINEQVTYLPRNLSQLTSYTSFNVSIFHKNVKLFSQQIRTLESGEFDLILILI